MNSSLIIFLGDYGGHVSLEVKITKRSLARSKHWDDISHSLLAKPNSSLSNPF